MFRRFLFQQWKTAIRAPMWQKSLALNLVIGFFLVLFGMELLLLGIFLDRIIEDLVPDRNPYELFNSILLYYFMADLLIRFMAQALPRLNIESYLHLPIKKRTIVHFMVGRTIIDIFNFLPLLIFIPITFTIAIPELGYRHAFIWIIMVLSMILANNFFASLLKRVLGVKPLFIAIIAIVFASLITLDRTRIISLSHLSERGFAFIAGHYFMVCLPLLWMLAAYYLHYRFLSNHLYPEEMQKKKSYEVQTGPTNSYIKSLGLTGAILSLEFKLYRRNKRTRTILYMSPLFLLYGLIFYNDPRYQANNGWLMFVGIFMTGGMMLNYANYAFGYESAYFDTLLTKNIDFRQYIRVKFLIAVMISTVFYVLTIPYVLFGYKILLINTAMFLYNIGVLSFALLFFATYNKKRMDLTRGGSFNYQGIGAMNWLAVFPAFLLPVAIYIPFKFADSPNTGIAFIGLLGIIGLFFSKNLVNLITRNFYKRKYIMAASFRER